MRLIVIGGVAAGLSAASRARRIDRELEILVLEKSGHVSWAACGLPYFIEGQVRDLAELVQHSPEFFRRERNIEVRTGAEVVAVSAPRREVVLRGGERLDYDRLIIATGARPAGIPGAFPLHTLEDARKLRDYLETGRPKRAAVVGAGYIGLEIATALRARGLEVVVFEASQSVLGREDAELAGRVAALLERFGIRLCLGRAVTQPDGASDLTVCAAGLRPNVELASGAGIELGPTGAIRVSQRMETSLTGVWAAGDCAETVHLVTGRPAYIPLGTTANKMGRVAGANSAGGRERFPGVAGTSIVRICGMAFGFTGLTAAEARREGYDAVSARVEARDRAKYFWGRPVEVELTADRRSGRLLGGTVIGESGVEGRINVLAGAVTSRMSIDEFQHLDLAYTPPYAQVWDPLLIAAQQAARLIH